MVAHGGPRARALGRRAVLLLADEPTRNLDTQRSYFLARRAALLDPIEALRYE